MNAAITGQVLPDSVVLWLLVGCMAMTLWGCAAPRPISSIIRDALTRARRHYLNMRTR